MPARGGWIIHTHIHIRITHTHTHTHTHHLEKIVAHGEGHRGPFQIFLRHCIQLPLASNVCGLFWGVVSFRLADPACLHLFVYAWVQVPREGGSDGGRKRDEPKDRDTYKCRVEKHTQTHTHMHSRSDDHDTLFVSNCPTHTNTHTHTP